MINYRLILNLDCIQFPGFATHRTNTICYLTTLCLVIPDNSKSLIYIFIKLKKIGKLVVLDILIREPSLLLSTLGTEPAPSSCHSKALPHTDT